MCQCQHKGVIILVKSDSSFSFAVCLSHDSTCGGYFERALHSALEHIHTAHQVKRKGNGMVPGCPRQ